MSIGIGPRLGPRRPSRRFRFRNSSDGGGSAFVNTYSTAFDGVDEYASLGVGSYAFENNEAYSFCFWIKTSSASSGTIIANLDISGGYRGYEIRILAGVLDIQIIGAPGSNWSQKRTTGTVNDGSWHHVAFTKSTSLAVSGQNFYIDGSPAATTDLKDTLSGTTVGSADLRIGARENGSSQMVAGNLDEFLIFNTELSAAQVLAIYNSGAPKDESSHTGIQSYYRMGDGDTHPTLTDNVGSVDGTLANSESADFQEDVP